MTDAIVLLGLRDQASHLSRRAREFGWTTEFVSDLDGLRLTLARTRVVAVYFDPRVLEMSWERALGHVMRTAPNAYPIACTHFSDCVTVDEFTAGGGFYVLHVPLAEHEVQQSLGFLHAALGRKRSKVTALTNAAKAS